MAKLNRQNIPFTQVANEVLNDNNLSFKAKGLYAYLFSKPDDWDFSAHRIKLEASDGRDSVLSALKELEEKGYLQRKKLPSGRTEYFLKHHNDPNTENPTLGVEPNTENPTYGKSHSGKTRTISNKELITTNILNNTSEETSQVSSNDISEALDCFRLLNDNYSNFFRNTTQRKAIKELIEKYKLEKVLKAIYLAKFSMSDQFFPNFITPHELQIKWAKVIRFFQNKKAKDKRFIEEFERFMISMESQKNEGKEKKALKVTIAGVEMTYELVQ